MKHNHELVAQLQLPEGKAARKIKGQIVIVSVSPKKEIKKVEKQPTTLQFTVRPWGCNNEQVCTTSVARFADKDSRLKVEKSVLGKWGKNSTAIEYKIIVPSNYPDEISIIAKHARDITKTIIYRPDGNVDKLLPRNQ